jgi:2-polyprenyl-3-methyl-5-hydroxy-6-metoxy-1,4-benzoquinol methylase
MMNCLLCRSDDYEVLERAKSFGYPLVYYQCKRCGLVYQSVEESQAADPDFYAETYREIYQGAPEPTKKDLYVQKKRAEFLIRFLRQHSDQSPSRILDIGASSGSLLTAFQQDFDCRVTGVEPGDAYRAYAESQGLEMSPSLESLVAAKPGCYDLVSMIHVLEHLPEPVETLRMIRKELLSQGGLLLIEVPNFYAHDSYELAHLACFTPHTLKQALFRAGFEVKILKQHGEPRSDLLKLYLTILAVPAKSPDAGFKIGPERFVGLKRRFGLLYRRLVQKLFPRRAWRPLPDGNEE